MNISLEDSANLGNFGKKATDILVSMIDYHEVSSPDEMFFRYELFESYVKDIKNIFPKMSEVYMARYKYIEGNNFSKDYFSNF